MTYYYPKEMSTLQKENLLKKINQKREMMLKTAKLTGFGSKHTLESSREVDLLIIQYQRLTVSEG